MKRRILFIQNPGSSEPLQQGIPAMVKRYKAFFRSAAGGFWNDNEFVDVDRLRPNGVSIQSDFVFKLKEINALDVDYSIIIFIGHGAALDHKDHIQIESGETCPIDCLTKGLYGQDIKRTVILDACRVGYVSTPQGWILESRAFSGEGQLDGSMCQIYYNELIEGTEPHVDIIQSTQSGAPAYGSADGTNFSAALLDTLRDNAKLWNAQAMGNQYGRITKCYPDVHSLVTSKLSKQISDFSQTKPITPFPLYAVWRPVERNISTEPQKTQTLND